MQFFSQLSSLVLIFFFLPVAIKEFFSNVDTQGRNSLKSSSISCSCLDNFCPGMLGVRGIFFWKGGGLFHDNFEGGFESSYFQGSSTPGRLSYCISKGLNAFSLQKPFDLSLGKSKRAYNWLGRIGYWVRFENCYSSSHSKLIS